MFPEPTPHIPRQKAIFAVLLGLTFFGACSGDSRGGAGATDTTALATTSSIATTSTTASGPERTSTTPPPRQVEVAAFATQQEAAERLYALWGANDRPSADRESIATPDELDKLFGYPPSPEAKYRGCDLGEFGTSQCLFGNGQGGVTVTLSNASGGWTIQFIDPFG